MDPVIVLDRLTQLGFQVVQLPRYERYVAAERQGFAALLEYTAEGSLRQFSSAGLLLQGELALLVEWAGDNQFVSKNQQVHASAEMLADYQRFQRDLRTALGSSS